MKYLFTFFLTLFIAACHNPRPVMDGEDLLKKSQAFHDSLGKWPQAQLELHLQEPRLANPGRYSQIKLDNQDNYFKLQRNRDQNISQHILNGDGSKKVLLNGEEVIDSALIQKYRLDPGRNEGYRNYYYMMLGLPMSLDSNWVEKIGEAKMVHFAHQDAYKIPITLKKAVFSKEWILYLHDQDFRVLGLDMRAEEAESRGERKYFDQLIEIQGMKIPRFRHWHDLEDESYLGSDMIINNLAKGAIEN